MPENHIDLANIREWEDIEDAYEAREALARLRRLAAQPPAPVTVEVMGSEEQSSDYVEIARQAIRLSATEFVVHDEHFHRNPPDVSWTLSRSLGESLRPPPARGPHHREWPDLRFDPFCPDGTRASNNRTCVRGPSREMRPGAFPRCAFRQPFRDVLPFLTSDVYKNSIQHHENHAGYR